MHAEARGHRPVVFGQARGSLMVRGRRDSSRDGRCRGQPVRHDGHVPRRDGRVGGKTRAPRLGFARAFEPHPPGGCQPQAEATPSVVRTARSQVGRKPVSAVVEAMPAIPASGSVAAWSEVGGGKARKSVPSMVEAGGRWVAVASGAGGVARWFSVAGRGGVGDCGSTPSARARGPECGRRPVGRVHASEARRRRR